MRHPELDGLRGIAVLLVLFRHIGRALEERGELSPLFRPWLNGWIGVDLFFVLSGFLIGTNVLRHVVYGDLPIWRYLLRRVLRIVPAYYAVLIVVAAGFLPFYPPPQQGLGISVAYHLLFLQDYLPSNIVVAFWSLGVEEKFYLLVPGLLFGVAKLPRPVAITLVVLLAILPTGFRYQTLLANPQITTYDACFSLLRSPFHLAMDGMLLGVAIALAPSLPKPNGVFSLCVGVIAVLFVQPFLLEPVTVWSAVLLFAVLATAFAGIVWASVSGRTWATPLLSNPVLAHLGTLSYAIYLVHMLFLDLAWDLAPWPLGFVIVGGGLSYGGAMVLHYAVERPFLRLKDRV